MEQIWGNLPTFNLTIDKYTILASAQPNFTQTQRMHEDK